MMPAQNGLRIPRQKCWRDIINMSVIFRTCSLYDRTEAKSLKANPALKEAIKRFIETKAANPLAAFGAKDYTFTNAGHFKGLLHAHLTRDVSIIYRVHSKDPQWIFT